jgi:hypothetical protein
MSWWVNYRYCTWVLLSTSSPGGALLAQPYELEGGQAVRRQEVGPVHHILPPFSLNIILLVILILVVVAVIGGRCAPHLKKTRLLNKSINKNMWMFYINLSFWIRDPDVKTALKFWDILKYL